MLSQWDYFLKNLGEWKGSFTRYSFRGEELEDTPSLITFTGSNENKQVRQVLTYMPVDAPSKEIVIDYTYLNTSIRFFDNGAFCQGSLQFSSYGEFGAEFGLIEGDRRLRMVQLFNNSGKFDRFTLIREQKGGSNAPEQPPLTVDRLLGEWKGEATTIYPDWRNPDIDATYMKLECPSEDRLRYTINFKIDGLQRTASSEGKIDGSTLHFESGNLPVQVLLLPDGASCNCPREIKLGQPFFLETGWLCQPNLRYRMIRNYNAKGEWVSLTLVREEKI
jgi:Domain of unknown function (DUF3598)